MIGLVDEHGRSGTIPESPPVPGTKLYAAPYPLIARIIGLNNELYVGYLHSTTYPVKLSLSSFVRGHTAVIGKTGSGKSHTVGAIIEELLLRKLPVFIVDPHSEYRFLSVASRTDRKMHSYYDASPRSFSVNRIRWTMGHVSEKGFPIKEYYLKTSVLPTTSPSQKQRGTEFRMSILGEDGRAIGLPDLMQSGRATILDLLGVDPAMAERTVSAILTNLFLSRRNKKIRPFVLVIEEAHSFAPERGFGSSKALDIMVTIAKEARKFNMPTIFVTQRPQLINKTVLAMCQNWFILKISNPLDLEAVTSMCEGTTPNSKDLIRNLKTGTALISGLTESPILVDVRCKRSAIGLSTDLVSELSKFNEAD